MESRFYTSSDGLRLRVLDARPTRDESRLPAVCLAGLTRGAVDFGPLAAALASDGATPRRVVAFDYRGRGLSDHDTDWTHYTLEVERADILRGLEGLGIDRAHFIGTSRGGLHIMALAETHRAMIGSAVFNDIGPVLEPAGLARIKGYVGVAANPVSLEDAVAILKRGAGSCFEGLDDKAWRHFARTTFGDDETALRYRYDPRLARTLDGLDLTRPLPDSWAAFDLLRGRPVLTLRGSGSDLLSKETSDAMGRRWAECETVVVDGQGHAPLLADAPTIERIRAFLLAADPIEA